MPEVLEEIPDIAFVYFDSQDVVRHKLVQHIVKAYKAHDDEIEASPAQRKTPPGPFREGAGS